MDTYSRTRGGLGLQIRSIIAGFDLRATPHAGRRLFFVTFGIVLTAFSIALARVSGVGTDQFTAFTIAASEHLGMSLGNFQALFNALFFVLVIALGTRRIGWGTAINMLGVGYMIEFFTWALAPLKHLLPAFPLAALGLVGGFALFSLSISLYLRCGMGVAPYDAFAPVMALRTHSTYEVWRIAQDLVFIAIAWALHGPLGVFTVVEALGTGPAIQWIDLHVTRPLYLRLHVLSPDEEKRQFADD